MTEGWGALDRGFYMRGSLVLWLRTRHMWGSQTSKIDEFDRSCWTHHTLNRVERRLDANEHGCEEPGAGRAKGQLLVMREQILICQNTRQTVCQAKLRPSGQASQRRPRAPATAPSGRPGCVAPFSPPVCAHPMARSCATRVAMAGTPKFRRGDRKNDEKRRFLSSWFSLLSL